MLSTLQSMHMGGVQAMHATVYREVLLALCGLVETVGQPLLEQGSPNNKRGLTTWGRSVIRPLVFVRIRMVVTTQKPSNRPP